MVQDFKLPDLGEGIHEGEIVDVLVSVGDRVQEDQPILAVETDKAMVEIPSPSTGMVKEIRVKPGETVKVGHVLIVFETEEAPAAQFPEPVPSAPAGDPAKTQRSSGMTPDGLAPAGAPLTGAAFRLASVGGPAPAPPGPGGERKKTPVPASPATRRLARELGVDLGSITRPSGPAGLVTAEDVRSFAARGKAAAGAEPAGRVPEATALAPPVSIEAPPLPGFDRWGFVDREPLRSVRRATARQMQLSWSQIPHVSHQDEADITELEVFRKKRASEVEARGGKLTILSFALKAAAAALKRYPFFNSSLDARAEEIILKRYYNIGVAVDTERGLIVPVVRDVDKKSITELSVELHRLAQKTREGKASLDEMQGGTFTVTNIGAIGGTAFAPIINYPEAAIMGLAHAKARPVVRGEGASRKIVSRLILPLILAFDHRVADGADAARFLRMVADLLEDPEELLLAI